jgi:hypothetical protein
MVDRMIEAGLLKDLEKRLKPRDHLKALMACLALNKAEALRICLKKGADPLVDVMGQIPYVFFAIHGNQLELVKVIAETHGDQLETLRDKDGYTGLFFCRDDKMAEFLMAYIPLDATTKTGLHAINHHKRSSVSPQPFSTMVETGVIFTLLRVLPEDVVRCYF